MPKNISEGLKLLVISDTGMCLKHGQWHAFGPVVRELHYLLRLFSEITWIGFNRSDQEQNRAYIPIDSNHIAVSALERVGGVTINSKLKILSEYPNMWRKIKAEIKAHHYIHVRAPSHPAMIAMSLSKRFDTKQFWFKYAGSWVDNAPKTYAYQRRQLKGLKENSIVTVNGAWTAQPKHVLAFDNPCLDEGDRILGKHVVASKQFSDGINMCFVGGLNTNKGILKFLKALHSIDDNLFNEIHIAGDGPLSAQIKKEYGHPKLKFHGLLNKPDVVSIYKQSHFIVLPSRSEGFPKVVSEAMNYGCIPIVSNISCISQLVSEENGFLLDNLNNQEIKRILSKALAMDAETYQSMISINYTLANRFTYDSYLKRITAEIFTF